MAHTRFTTHGTPAFLSSSAFAVACSWSILASITFPGLTLPRGAGLGGWLTRQIVAESSAREVKTPPPAFGASPGMCSR